MAMLEHLTQQIQTHPMIVYMKGTPQFPQCGFSGQVAHILNTSGAKYAYVNVLANPEVRRLLPQVANWPTFPQLYIQGELVGGCDIITELYEQGELQKMLEAAELVTEKAEFIAAE
jgi:monothiol glutaredoxin